MQFTMSHRKEGSENSSGVPECPRLGHLEALFRETEHLDLHEWGPPGFSWATGNCFSIIEHLRIAEDSRAWASELLGAGCGFSWPWLLSCCFSDLLILLVLNLLSQNQAWKQRGPFLNIKITWIKTKHASIFEIKQNISKSCLSF